MNADALCNRAEAIERLGGDEALYASVAQLFVAGSAACCAVLEAAVQDADAAALRREAHTVKSMLATFSYEEGRALAQRLEELAATGELEGARPLTAELVGAVGRLAAALASEAMWPSVNGL